MTIDAPRVPQHSFESPGQTWCWPRAWLPTRIAVSNRDRLTAKNERPEGDRSDKSRPPVVWFEVEDFLRYFDHFRNPTGLQRVPFEIFVEAQRLYSSSARVRFCRLSAYTKQFQPVAFDAIMSAYLKPPGAKAPWKTIWEPAQFWNKFSSVLPAIVRHPRFFLSIFASAIRDFLSTGQRRRDFEHLVRRGDMIVSLGASWGIPHYMEHITEAKRRYGVKFAFLIHDLIPIENAPFVEDGHVVLFREWLQDAIPAADVILTTSNHSRDALIKLAKNAALPLRRVEVVPLGSGLSERPMAGEQRTISLPERYVLFVSTIEIRKNHQLLVRVWRRLLERHGVDAVPDLLFVGQIGWLVDDLLADLKASNYLNGKVKLLPGLSDAEVRQAYRRCLFTVFPSLCEGWGLPIAESLMQGKICIASNRAPLPEVGGDLIDYFDPSDEDDALEKIEQLLFDPSYLTMRETRLRTEYRPRTWADCVRVLIGKLDQFEPAERFESNESRASV